MKVLKEPLFHFVILGGLLFACYQVFDPESREPGETEVRVPPGRIEQLSAIFAKTWQRPPTRGELEGLVDDFVMEEIYYREATAAGLDRDDTLIRRRMRQKLEFLTDDFAVAVPDDEDLRKFVDQNPDRFRDAGSTTFRQVYYNPDKLGGTLDEALAAAAALLEKGEAPEGHPTLLPETMDEATPIQITGTFGADFADKLAGVPVGEWSGPLRSTFGYHFVRVEDRRPGEMPPLEKILPQVVREWEHEQREQFRAEFDSKLLEKYEVSVEWPGEGKPGA